MAASQDFTITTIYFNGQFCKAFIQRMLGGVLFTSEYTFGKEPANPQIIQWVNEELPLLKFYKTDSTELKRITPKKNDCSKKSFNKALNAYKDAQKTFLEEKKSSKKQIQRQEKEQKYILKKLKKKQQKRH